MVFLWGFFLIDGDVCVSDTDIYTIFVWWHTMCAFQYVIILNFFFAVTVRIPLLDFERTTSEQLFEWIRWLNFTGLKNSCFVVRSWDTVFFSSFIFFSIHVSKCFTLTWRFRTDNEILLISISVEFMLEFVTNHFKSHLFLVFAKKIRHSSEEIEMMGSAETRKMPFFCC